MPAVALAHVTVRYELIELPAVCPNTVGEEKALCDADLSALGALKVWEWSEQQWPAHLPRAGDETTHDNLVVEHDAGSEGGESWIELVAYYCTSCGTMLAEGTHEVHQAEARS
jgi:hypothetical protein